MSAGFRAILMVLVVVLLAAALFYGGMYYAARRYAPWVPGMMGGFGPNGMMGGFGYGSYGPGMMGGYGPNSRYGVKPLTVDQAKAAVESYLTGLKNNDLALKEIMVFDNNAYAAVIEKSTHIGAFELLVDPVSQSVFPEYGPNMMWNLKYGMMSGFGGYGIMGPGMMGRGFGYDQGGMMGGYGFNNGSAAPQVSADMPVAPDQAVQAAQEYLDRALPGAVATDDLTPFYGYYTIDIARAGDIVGMLSVNGYTRQVFFHTWHGVFIATSEE